MKNFNICQERPGRCVVKADTKRFGKQEIMYEGTCRVECERWLKEMGLASTVDGYNIFTGVNRRTGGFLKKLIKGSRIRIDLIAGYPLWKVPELIRCENWKIADKYQANGRETVYIDIL